LLFGLEILEIRNSDVCSVGAGKFGSSTQYTNFGLGRGGSLLLRNHGRLQCLSLNLLRCLPWSLHAPSGFRLATCLSFDGDYLYVASLPLIRINDASTCIASALVWFSLDRNITKMDNFVESNLESAILFLL